MWQSHENSTSASSMNWIPFGGLRCLPVGNYYLQMRNRSGLRRQNNNRRRVRNNRNIPRSQGVISHPPSFQSTVSFNKRIRFQASSALNAVNVTSDELATLLGMATSTTSVYPLTVAFKLIAVEMWGPMSSSLSPVIVSCEYPPLSSTPTSGPTKVYSDTSMGSSEAAHVRTMPAEGSGQSFWQTFGSAGDTFFILNGPSGTVVDVTIQYVIFNGEGPGTVRTVVGATVGQIYLAALDHAGSGLLIPTAYLTV